MSKMNAGVLALGATLTLFGCESAEKKEAMAGAEEIDKLCKAGKKDEASKKGQELYGKNAHFKKNVDAAAKGWKVDDMSKFAYCGIGFVEAKTRMEH